MKLKKGINYVNIDIDLIVPDEKFSIYYRKGKPTDYAISTEGRVYNLKTQTLRKIHHRKNLYREVGISLGNKNDCHTCSVHRMVAETFLDGQDLENGINTVDHINGVENGDSIYNLEWVTHTENLQRASRNGLLARKRGSESPHNKYTDAQVTLACELKSMGYTNRHISKETGIKYDYLSKIFSGRKWCHISNNFIFDIQHHIPKIIKSMIIELIRYGYSNKHITNIIYDKFNFTLNKNYVKDMRRVLKKKQEGSTTIENYNNYYTIDINM